MGLPQELGVSRGVVTEAYGQLAAEGYLTTSQGAPVRVAKAVRASSQRPPARSLLQSFSYNFHPGLPDLSDFPREAWLRSLRGALRDSPLDSLGYGDPRGVPALREALAGYLGRVRGADADPEHMLVCTGFMQGFSLLCRALRGHGVEQVALEDPGWHLHRLIVEQAGLGWCRSQSTRADCASMRLPRPTPRRCCSHPPTSSRPALCSPRAAGGADRVGRGASG